MDFVGNFFPCVSEKKEKKKGVVHSFVWIELLPFFSSSSQCFSLLLFFPYSFFFFLLTIRSNGKDFLGKKSIDLVVLFGPNSPISLVRFLLTMSMF